MIMSLVFAGEIWLLGRWVGVTLTAEAAIVHSLRRRTIAWDRIAAIQIERFMGSHRIVLYENSGRRPRCGCRSPGSCPGIPCSRRRRR